MSEPTSRLLGLDTYALSFLSFTSPIYLYKGVARRFSKQT